MYEKPPRTPETGLQKISPSEKGEIVVQKLDGSPVLPEMRCA